MVAWSPELKRGKKERTNENLEDTMKMVGSIRYFLRFFELDFLGALYLLLHVFLLTTLSCIPLNFKIWEAQYSIMWFTLLDH